MNFNDKFPQIYVINLKSREDRATAVAEQFAKIGCTYELFEAIDGKTLDVQLVQTPEKRWNKAAYALALTTIRILEDALEKGYESILICEDDIAFHECLDLQISGALTYTPNYDFLFFGYTETTPPIIYNTYWSKLVSAFSCHCYAVNKNIMPMYKKLLERLDNPIDVYTNMIMGARLKSYGANTLGSEKLVYQVNGISDIQGGFYDTSFTR